MNTVPLNDLIRDQDITIKNGNGKITDFVDFGFSDDIIDGICACDFCEPSLIQQYAIPILLSGKDLLMQSQSGSGKTLAFLLSALHSIDRNYQGCQAIVISHTRELTNQTAQVFDNITADIDDFTRSIVLPGIVCDDDVQFFFGTAVSIVNKIKMLLPMGLFDPMRVKYLIIDEADAVLVDNFGQPSQVLNAAWAIKSLVPHAQTVLVSATMPPSFSTIVPRFLKPNHSEIIIEKNFIPVEIAQIYMNVPLDLRPQIVLDIIKEYNKLCYEGKNMGFGQALIFVSLKQHGIMMDQYLKSQGLTSTLLMSDIGKNERDEVVQEFLQKRIRFLITTDVIARGFDNVLINFVVNFTLPKNADSSINFETYTHRIGRTGRIGFKGLALSFVDQYEKQMLIDGSIKRGFTVTEMKVNEIHLVMDKMEENEEKNRERKDLE